MPELSKTAPETISEAYYSLTAAEKRCADYVLAHQQEAQFLSITELAEVSNVAEATVSRFCRRLATGAIMPSSWPWPTPPPSWEPGAIPFPEKLRRRTAWRTCAGNCRLWTPPPFPRPWK